MPSLDAVGASVSPWADPLTYPGTAVDVDYLWLDSWMYEILPPPTPAIGAVDRVDPVGPGDVVEVGTLGRWVVKVDGGPLELPPTISSASLDDALAIVGAAPMSARRPVMSFGSNSAPAQLRAKFAPLAAASRVIPVTRAVISGLGLGYSPHVSDPGYMPYVLVAGDAASRLAVFVLWLDAEQLLVMNGSEPNYDLVFVPTDTHALTLATGELVSGCVAYRGKWGALRRPSGLAPLTAGSQVEVLAELNTVPWFPLLVGGGDARSQVIRLRESRALRDRVRVELAGSGMVIGDGWSATDR